MGVVLELKSSKIKNALNTKNILDMIIDPHKRKSIQKHFENQDDDYGINFVESMKEKKKLYSEE
ncbi:hypothetical protein [Paenibacillus sp. FSL M7-0420]|uniref:hypothetical protein n=1 Tax=Paenibacillus sp. FSL M7-0420 TaxID=2921609 RepID=UPI0030F65D4C